MAFVEAALKSSFRKEMAMKFSPQTLFLEELSAFNVVQNVATCDDFFVDDLLDFSHEEALLEEEPQQNHGSASVSPQHENQHQSHEICNLSFNDHFGSVPTSELTVPDEDAADLEWLSHFVEDSFSEYSISFPTVNLTENLKQKAPEPGSPVSARPFFKTPVPAKARSKRSRTGVPVWPLGFPFFTESSSSTSSSTTTTSSSSSSSPSSPLLIYATVAQNIDRVCSERKLPQKKVKRKTKPEGEGCCGAAQAPAPRRCSHCGIQKTPQWRTGPLGAKTLCNACGVRFKSGRLLPEYRPACSPTFSSELHSNHHRKVLEMRRKKEVTGGPETGSATPPAVPGF